MQMLLNQVCSCCFSPDDSTLVTGDIQSNICLWSISSGLHFSTLVGHQGAVSDLEFSSDGKFLLSGSRDRTARLWNPHSGDEIRRFIHDDDAVSDVSFSPDAKNLLTAQLSAYVWDIEANIIVKSFPPRLVNSTHIESVAFSRDGHHIFVGDSQGDVCQWEWLTSKLIRTFIAPGQPALDIKVDRTNKYLIISGEYGSSLYDLHLGTHIRTYEEGLVVSSATFSPDSKYIATSDHTKNIVNIWTVETGNLIHTLIGHTGPITAVTFSFDGQKLLSGSIDGTARLWDTKTERELLRLDHRELSQS